MSRVFEALTAAVDEKQNPAKPEVSGTESQGDLILGFPTRPTGRKRVQRNLLFAR